MAVTYEQLKNATLEQLQGDQALKTAFGQVYYGGNNTDPSTLINQYAAGTRSFDNDKSYVLSNLNDPGRAFGRELQYNLDRYSNWNNPANPNDYQAALSEREKGLARLQQETEQWSARGIDPMSLAWVQNFYKGFGVTPGGGITSQQAAGSRTGSVTEDFLAPSPTVGGQVMAAGTKDPMELGRRLGPTEFSNLRQELGVSEANFDQYFSRDDKGNIYLKPTTGAPKRETFSLGGRTFELDTQGNVREVGAAGTDMSKLSVDDLYRGANIKTSPATITDFLTRTQAESEELQRRIIESLNPSARETDLQKQLDEGVGGLNRGVLNIEGQTIPTGIEGAQAENLKRQALLVLEPLQKELEREGTKRKGVIDTLSTALGFQQKNTETQAKIYEEMQKPILEANKRVQDYVFGLAKSYPDAGIGLNDSAEAAAAKVSKSKLYQDSIRMLGAGGGSGGGGGGSTPSPVISPPKPTTPKQTLEQYIAEKENAAGMSFGPAKRAALKAEFEAKNKVDPSENIDTSGVDERAVAIFNGTSTLRPTDYSTKDRPIVDAGLATLRQRAFEQGNFVGVMRASAGGKDPSDSFLASFDKGLNVVHQIGDLQNTINYGARLPDGTVIPEATGPLTGLIRSNNPYDKKAQLIKAQLSAIVPNLARGIYGEVGVLTDNDIRLYSKTLPNLYSTEEISKAILGLTIRTVQRSLENKLRTQANAGRDVSGFVDTYIQLDALAKGIEAGLNKTGSTGIDSVKSRYNVSY